MVAAGTILDIELLDHIVIGKQRFALGELLTLVDEMADDPQALSRLSLELADLEKKLPREFKEAAEGWRPNDPSWLKGLLAEAKPMLIERLLQGREAG